MSDERISKPRVPSVSGTRSGARYCAAITDNILAIIFAMTAGHLLPIEHEMTRGIRWVYFFRKSFPVDVRDNAKIHRLALARILRRAEATIINLEDQKGD